MRNARRHILFAWSLPCCLLGFALAASAQPDVDGDPSSSSFIRIPHDTDDWTRHFRIGAMAGMNISAKFNENGLFNIPGNNAPGIYDDGYVREDQTGDAGGLTSNWGYDNASQYNAANNSLTFHSTSSYSTSGSGQDGGGPFPGFDMAYGDNLWYWKHARVGWELGFGMLPISITDDQPMGATISQSTYTFDTTGILSMPVAPYQGQGGSSGTGPVISDTPESSSTDNSLAGTVTGTRKIEAMLYTMRLGPSFYWDLTEHIGMSLGAGPAFGIVTGDYKYNETITVNNSSTHNSGKFGATDFTCGGYVNATVMYHVQDNADIYVGAQYMPMSSASFSGAGREGQLDLSGQLYFSIGINWPF